MSSGQQPWVVVRRTQFAAFEPVYHALDKWASTALGQSLQQIASWCATDHTVAAVVPDFAAPVLALIVQGESWQWKA